MELMDPSDDEDEDAEPGSVRSKTPQGGAGTPTPGAPEGQANPAADAVEENGLGEGSPAPAGGPGGQQAPPVQAAKPASKKTVAGESDDDIMEVEGDPSSSSEDEAPVSIFSNEFLPWCTG